MPNGFDRIAWIYDRLATLVFGKSIVDSQVVYFDEISTGSRILILGGGTGWILEPLFAIRPDCQVTFIDASAEMIDRARQHVSGPEAVTFIHGTEDDIPPGSTFDVVVTNFYLDLFPEKNLELPIRKITSSIAEGGSWIVTEFVDGKWWQGFMLHTMYLFFRLASGIQARSLPRWKKSLRRAGWSQGLSKKFYGDFIEAVIFVRRPD